ncbi:winged helix-turn-helix transcriptional regulator [Aerococcaceae bacterium NML201209]|nr:winged helix-turn-helix transcriptional regulator [Aerococcaceae bacterium NML201209]
MLNQNEQRVLELLEANPFLSQQEVADRLAMNRSTVATIISTLIAKKQLLGRAYIVNRQQDVYCIGAMNVDRKFTLQQPLVPKTSNPVSSSMSVGGVARNIAENLGRLGQRVSLLSVAGRDQDYEWVKQQSEPHINFQHVTQLTGYATSAYSAILDESGEMQLALADMAICDQMTADWLTSHRPLLAQAKMIVLDLNAPLATVEAVIEIARHYQLDLVVIPVSSPKMNHLPRNLAGVTWLIVNQDESETFFDRRVRTNEDFEALAELWLEAGVANVVITRGKKKSYYANQAGVRTHYQPPVVSEVVDVTGAGDSFAAGLVYGQLSGRTPAESIGLAMTNAYYTIQSSQTVRPELNEATLLNDYQYLQKEGVI